MGVADPAGATGTYYALLFTLAQYLQQGLGDSPFISGLTLVPWVAAFGLAGQLVRRLPPRMVPLAPGAGCLLLAISYLAISVTLFTGEHGEARLAALLAVGGLGLGIQFSALIVHLTNVVPARYASDISGVSTTTLQIGGSVGVAAFGTLYLSLTTSAGSPQATHAFCDHDRRPRRDRAVGKRHGLPSDPLAVPNDRRLRCVEAGDGTAVETC